MKVAVIGSRGYPHLDRVRLYVSELPPGTVIVSGGASGVDTAASSAADEFGLEKLIIPVSKEEWDRLGKKAGPLRNTKIVEAANIVVAFWDAKSRGTLDAITQAVERGKKVIIYGPRRNENGDNHSASGR